MECVEDRLPLGGEPAEDQHGSRSDVGQHAAQPLSVEALRKSLDGFRTFGAHRLLSTPNRASLGAGRVPADSVGMYAMNRPQWQS